MFQMLGVFAEFESAMIRERVRAGVAHTKRHGTKSGRAIGRPKLDLKREAAVRRSLQAGNGIVKTAKAIGVGTGKDGLFLAGHTLLERDSAGRFRPRPAAEVRKIFANTYRAETDWESRVRSVVVVAAALNQGDVARAMIAAVLMKMPDPDGKTSIADVDGNLAKANFNPLEPRDAHGRWSREGTNNDADSRQAFLEPFFEPFIEEELLEPDELAPTLGPRFVPPIPLIRNPFPHRPECEEQWAHAHEECDKLRRKGKLKWDDSRRYSISYAQCVRGMVSEDCGGTPVEYA